MTKKSGAQQRRKQREKLAAAANGTASPLGNGANDSSSSAEPSPRLNGFPSASTFDFDLEADMSDADKAERRKDEGTAAYKRGAYQDALALYSSAVSLAPENAAYVFNRAAAQMALKNYASAEEDCQTVASVQKEAPSSKTLARLGKCQLALGKADHAVSTLETAVTLDESNAAAKSDLLKAREVLSGIFSVLRDKERQDWAVMTFGLDQIERKVEVVPLAWRLWRVEGLLGRKPPRVDEAAGLANDILRRVPSNPDALFWRGRVLYVQGETDKAVQHWKEALRCDPDYSAAKAAWTVAKQIEAKKEQGNEFFKSGRLEEAIAAYTEAIEVDISNEAVAATLLSNRATAKLKLKRYDEALEDCDACLALQSDYVKALRTQGKCYTALERWGDAVASYKSAVSNAPGGSQLERELKTELKGAEGDLKRSKMKDHYKIVGVERDASEYEIKRAYKFASLRVHPDKPGGSEAKFQELQQSFEILSDPRRRQMYDNGEDENEQPSMPDFASAFGGGGGFGGQPFFTFSSQGGSPFGGGGSPFESMFGQGGGRGFHQFHSHGF